MKIWLDDLRREPDGWERTFNARTTIRLLKTGDVEEISLDHDLGNEEIVGTGYDVVKFLEREAFHGRFWIDPDKIKIHSANIVGSKNMQRGIDSIKLLTFKG